MALGGGRGEEGLSSPYVGVLCASERVRYYERENKGEYKRENRPKEDRHRPRYSTEKYKLLILGRESLLLKHVNTVNLRPAAGGEGCRDPGKAGMLHTSPNILLCILMTALVSPPSPLKHKATLYNQEYTLYAINCRHYEAAQTSAPPANKLRIVNS